MRLPTAPREPRTPNASGSAEKPKRRCPVACVAGLRPEVVRYVLPEEHLIAGPIAAQPFSEAPDRYREVETLRFVVCAVRRVHAFPPLDHTFDPSAHPQEL